MRKLYSLIIMLCTILMLTACQQTPNRNIVISKKTEKLDTELEKENITETFSFDFPDNWEASYEKYDGKFKMTIDADIIVEDVTKYPVVKIMPYYIPIKQATKIVKELFGQDEEVYFNNIETTREQLEEFIIKVKAEYQDAKNKGDDRAENLKETISHLIGLLDDAPEEVTLTPYNGEYKIHKDSESEQHSIELRKDPFDLDTPVLQIINLIKSPYSNGYDSWVSYENAMREVYIYRDDNIGMKYTDNPLFNTKEAKKAIDIANRFIENIGIENVEIENMYALKSEPDSKDISSYKMFYARRFNNILIPLLVQMGGSRTNSNEENHICPFRSETLLVEVQGDEIVNFEWSDMYKIDTTLSENVELMPFEEIMENAENQLAVKYAYVEEDDYKEELYVDEIKLTYAVEPIKDRKYEYMLIPVWAFYGGIDYGEGYELSDGTVLKGKNKESISFLTVNAIDGSVILGQ